MRQHIYRLFLLSGALVLLNACGNQQDWVATSVAQTVTSIAAANPAATQTPFPTIIPISSPAPSPGSEQTVAPTTPPTTEPTIAPTTPPTTEPTIAPTDAPTTPPTTEPTIAPTNIPTTAPTAIPAGNVFIGASFPPGGSGSMQGALYLPGFNELPPQEGANLIFINRFNLRVYTYDPAVSSEGKDGAGIQEEEIRISKDGQDVFDKIERNAAYCLLGSDNPDCPILDFTKTKNWPDPDKRINQAIPIEDGDYQVNITITPQNGEQTFWNFNFTIRRS